MFYSKSMERIMEEVAENRRMINCYKLILEENKDAIGNEIKTLQDKNELLLNKFFEKCRERVNYND